jgi:H-type small acid-soluble spore protein
LYKVDNNIGADGKMDANRAKEIMTSPKITQVTFQGAPVWIESIDDTNDIAEVTVLKQMGRARVPVTELEG